MNDFEYSLTFNFEMNARIRRLIAIYPITNNKCCDKGFFLLTANSANGWESGINFSCQCGCGGFCTTGYSTEQEAVDAYRRMCGEEDKYAEIRRRLK
jgi:hypothetical protein